MSSGSCFTPAARQFHLKHLRQKKKKTRFSPLDEDGQLSYPPKKSRLEIEEEKKREELKKKRKAATPGIVSLEYLLSGDYWRDKKAAKEKRDKIKATKLRLKANNAIWSKWNDETYTFYSITIS